MTATKLVNGVVLHHTKTTSGTEVYGEKLKPGEMSSGIKTLYIGNHLFDEDHKFPESITVTVN